MTQRKPTDDFAQLIDAFLGYIKNVRNLSPNTFESYKIDLELFLEWTRAHNIDPLKLEHIQVRSYLAYMRQARYADKTVARRLSSLRSLSVARGGRLHYRRRACGYVDAKTFQEAS